MYQKKLVIYSMAILLCILLCSCHSRDIAETVKTAIDNSNATNITAIDDVVANKHFAITVKNYFEYQPPRNSLYHVRDDSMKTVGILVYVENTSKKEILAGCDGIYLDDVKISAVLPDDLHLLLDDVDPGKATVGCICAEVPKDESTWSSLKFHMIDGESNNAVTLNFPTLSEFYKDQSYKGGTEGSSDGLSELRGADAYVLGEDDSIEDKLSAAEIIYNSVFPDDADEVMVTDIGGTYFCGDYELNIQITSRDKLQPFGKATIKNAGNPVANGILYSDGTAIVMHVPGAPLFFTPYLSHSYGMQISVDSQFRNVGVSSPHDEIVPYIDESDVMDIDEDGGSKMYIWNTRIITRSDLNSMTKEEVSLMRNEIYARHGYIFKSQELQSYFESQPWYSSNPNFSESDLTPTERENRDLIIQFEKENGWR